MHKGVVNTWRYLVRCMFNKSLEYKLVQIRKNRFPKVESFIQEYIYRFENASWGFLAANLPNETVNTNNKRFRMYTEVLRRTFIRQFDVYVNKQNSVIFVIHKAKATEKQNIIEQYEQIFSEIN